MHIFSECNEYSGVTGRCLGTATTSVISVYNIKISMFLAEHGKTEENGFWELTGIINCPLRSEAVGKRPKYKKCPV